MGKLILICFIFSILLKDVFFVSQMNFHFSKYINVFEKSIHFKNMYGCFMIR